MFNITKQGSSLLITSNDNSQFPWKDGQMSLPMNSVVYVIDESDYIAFRSASNNDILFTALIDEIQINGTNVTKDDFILTFDNVANSAGGGGGSASAGVNSINGFQGDLTLKTVNGNSLIGSGDITIEGGGGSASAGVNSINGFQGDLTLKTVNGNSLIGSGDLTLKTVNGNSLIGSGDITIEGGGVSSVIVGETSTITNTFVGDVKFFPQYLDFGDGEIYWQFVMNGNAEDGNNYNSTFGGFTSNSKSIKISQSDSKTASLDVNEWIGTQSEYNALGTYDSGCTYYITE